MHTQLIGYCDANWGNDVDALNQLATVMPTGAMMWKIDTQCLEATSTCEAELNSIKEAAKQACYLRELLQELCLLQDKTPALFNKQPECPCCHQETWRREAQIDQAQPQNLFPDCVEWWEIPMSSFSGFPTDSEFAVAILVTNS